MNYKITFEERTKRAMEILAKQKPVTLEEARAQAKRISENSISKDKKKRV